MTLLACILYICNTAVSCDISKLNAILHPDNTLKTTALTVKLGVVEMVAVLSDTRVRQILFAR